MAKHRFQSGSQNLNWKGGRTIDPRGYVLIKMPEHHRADVRGYVYEHVLIAEKNLGRPLLPHEEVHHDDENKSNNKPDNLIVKSSRLLILWNTEGSCLEDNYQKNRIHLLSASAAA